MNVLARRILQETSPCAQISFIRRYSSTSRQEFGRQFEDIVAKSLRKLSFDVAVCGGPKDRGADLRGVWVLKSSSVPVIGQCKRYKKRLGPRHVRELEGTLTHEVKGTLGIIVSESGYSKDAYEVFMGSLYPIALTTLGGYSDDLLHWYSNEENDEQSVNQYLESTESDFVFQVQCKSADKPFQGDNDIMDNLNSKHTGSSNNGTFLNGNRQYHAQDYKNVDYNHGDLNQEHTVCDLKEEEGISMRSDECTSFRISTMDSMSQTSGFKDVNDNLEQLTDSDIAEIGSGEFTMFELNPVARKLLPNVVVGMKYTRHNSKALELFINEDDSFVTVT